MADDNSARYRSNDPFGRGPASATPANDPLAELARLIGRNDPFAEYGRARAGAAAPDPARSRRRTDAAPSTRSQPDAAVSTANRLRSLTANRLRYSEPAPHYDPRRAYSRAPALQSASRRRTYGIDPRPATPPIIRRAPRRSVRAQRLARAGAAASYPASDPFAPPQQPVCAAARPHHDNKGYAGPNYGSQPYADPRGRPATGQLSADRPGFGAARLSGSRRTGQVMRRRSIRTSRKPAAMPPPHDDEFYDDEPRGGRRKGLLTVVAVLGLAVIGTAGAFGYRSLFGGPGSSGRRR